MKLRIYFRPWLAVLLLGGAAGLSWGAVAVPGWPLGVIALPFSLFYSILFGLSAWALWRIHVLERWSSWDRAHRLLILAPHEDDCVISAGGIGLRNQALGGATRIVYLAPDEAPGLAKVRAAEASAAWREAGVECRELRHLDLLPPLRRRDPARLRAAAKALRSIIDDFKPTAIVMPMFEGGHIHHDMTAALIGAIVTGQDSFEIFEAPEYNPHVSLADTPHRIIALATRWLFGLAAYYGPPDGVDGRPILKIRLDRKEMAAKRRMLSAFVSQNAPSLVATRAYPDRLVRWQASGQRRYPFRPGVYERLATLARRYLPTVFAVRLFPIQDGPIGREGRLTDWREEWGDDAAER